MVVSLSGGGDSQSKVVFEWLLLDSRFGFSIIAGLISQLH